MSGVKVTPGRMPGVVLFELKRFGDDRGFFMEAWRDPVYRDAGVEGPFVQDNISKSTKGILRGLHFQNPNAQGKLVCVLDGEVEDVIVDIRQGSPTFGKWEKFTLSSANHFQLYVPPGFAHGFQVTSDEALFFYKCTEIYHPECEHSLRWDDPDLGIDWPLPNPELSTKDAEAKVLKDIPKENLPIYEE